MRDREFSYAIKIFEAQWDNRHDLSVKPFFEQLKRYTQSVDARRRGGQRNRLGHDALFSYCVFQNADGLRDELNRPDRGVGQRAKIGYFACHGGPKVICGVQNVSRTKLKSILGQRSGYDGFFFGACEFVDRQTATQLLAAAPYCKWVAGYANWTPWLEGLICDLMFFRLLLTGQLRRGRKTARWEPLRTPEGAARALYEDFPASLNLRFSLFYRTAGGIRSTLDQHDGDSGGLNPPSQWLATAKSGAAP